MRKLILIAKSVGTCLTFVYLYADQRLLFADVQIFLKFPQTTLWIVEPKIYHILLAELLDQKQRGTLHAGGAHSITLLLLVPYDCSPCNLSCDAVSSNQTQIIGVLVCEWHPLVF